MATANPISCATLTHENGIEFTTADVARFVDVFERCICLDGGELNTWITTARREPIGAATVARPGRRGRPRPGRAHGIVSWMHLAAYAPPIRERLDGAVATRVDLFPRGWFGDPALALAYAQRLAC